MRSYFSLLIIALTAGLSACGTPRPDPHTLVTDARSHLDHASAVHLTVSSTNAVGPGEFVVSGEGDARRPDMFRGRINASIAGLLVPVNVVAAGGTVWALPPFERHWLVINPHDYGFADPGPMIDPDHGLSSLLTVAYNLTEGDRDRLPGEEVEMEEVHALVPGNVVAALLESADPSQPMTATFGMEVESHILRRVVLSGPFLQKGSQATYTIVLANYSENVTITPPAA